MSVFYICLSATDRLWIKGQAYRLIERLEASHLLLNEDTRTVHAWNDDDLERLRLAGEIRIERHRLRPTSPPPQVSQVVATQLIAELPQRDRERINRREVYCRRFLEMERAGEAKRSDAAMHRAIAIIHAEMNEAEWLAAGRLAKARHSAGHIVAVRPPPSVRTMRRALKMLEHSGCPGMATAARTNRRAK
ncbi:hypothetical protein FQV39_10370 [Bosea sp. F3-2]|uniref:hypothetical protein n=1 Tax=Bosea sp. F3-2 TaxID=2599640 RepID=UPI0011EFFE26|nr:hypothetical protein [Bosea sp. F3-2]QEL22928.1 hypothetical protein FQV39_10370 [Bosea sp. F3-2]